MACGAKSKPRSTTGNNDQCFYGCEGSAQAAPGTSAPSTTAAAAPAKPAGKLTPAGERAALLRQAADLLEKAGDALAGGNKNLAEQLFSTAEILTGAEALASLAGQFREGAPPRVTTPTIAVDKNAPGIVAPAGTPKAIVERWQNEIAKAVQDPEIKARLEKLGFAPVANSPAEFGERLKAEMAKWGKVVRDAKIKAN